MRLNDFPIQVVNAEEELDGSRQQKRRQEEAAALAAMAQAPRPLLNGLEPDCLSAGCLQPDGRSLPPFRRVLAQARRAGVAGTMSA